MKLYSGPLSLFSRKVEIALAEKGLTFEREMVPFTQAAGYSPKHAVVLAANPKAQVPVLIDGELTLFDSTLIFEYLEDAYPKPALFPKGAAARANCRGIELAADEILLPLVARLMYRTEPADPDPIRQGQIEADGLKAEAAITDYYRALDESLVGREYFCDEFSFADIAMFMTVVFANRLGAPSISNFVLLDQWFNRVKARPSAGKAAEEIAEADRLLSPA